MVHRAQVILRECIMKLYYGPLSGHSHRARLFLSLLGMDYEPVELNLRAGDHKATEFLRLNRFGEVPVLDDDGTIIADSNAILVYLAKKGGTTGWIPEEAIERSHALLRVMDDELHNKNWIAGTVEPSIADVALYSYIDRAPEGNVDLAVYGNVRSWLRRVEALPGFFPFRKTKAGIEAGA